MDVNQSCHIFWSSYAHRLILRTKTHMECSVYTVHRVKQVSARHWDWMNLQACATALQGTTEHLEINAFRAHEVPDLLVYWRITDGLPSNRGFTLTMICYQVVLVRTRATQLSNARLEKKLVPVVATRIVFQMTPLVIRDLVAQSVVCHFTKAALTAFPVPTWQWPSFFSLYWRLLQFALHCWWLPFKHHSCRLPWKE